MSDPVPLVLDLDGTLIRTDLLVESFMALAAQKPLAALATLPALGRGKASLKARIADRAMVEVRSLPLNPAVVALAEQARADGRPVYLASASDLRYVQAFADHHGWFAGVLGTAAGINLSGRAKAEQLVERFGRGGFDYAGNDPVDLHVWRMCRRAYIADGSSRLQRRLLAERPDAVVLDRSPAGWRGYARALRPHQWLKNLLIFAPAAAAHALVPGLVPALLAFVAFCACASSVYLLNDLLDLAGDRDHPRKRRRPFASGAVPIARGLLLIPLLLLVAFVIALALPAKFMLGLAIYYGMTLSYSLYLKRKPIVDVVTLACLYGIRVVAGGFATGTELSPWLEALSAFLFLSLALVKRNAELIDRIEAGKGDPVGRGYRLTDVPALEAMAAAAGYNAALVLALYVNSPAVQLLYGHPHRLWLLCILLLAWISRIMLVTRRGWMDDDPVVFAVRDRWSLVIGAVGVIVIAVST